MPYHQLDQHDRGDFSLVHQMCPKVSH